jgi:hypothetical protein
MAIDLERYAEAYRRGLLNEDQNLRLEELERRGLVQLERPPIKQQQQVEQPKLNRLASIARTVMESTFPGLGARRDKDIKEEARNVLDIASYTTTPAGLVSKAAQAGKIAKFTTQTVPQAAAGAGATYLGQREKGVLRGESGIDAASGFGLELGAQATLKGIGKGLGFGAKQLTKKLPEDLVSKAKQYVADKSKTAEQRTRQIIRLGKKAIANNKKIETGLENFANKADKANKNVAKLAATKLKDANRKFHNDNKDKSKLITKISDDAIDNFIREEHRRLSIEAAPLIEGGMKKVRTAEEKVLKDFEERFFLKPKKVDTRPQLYDQFNRPIKQTAEEIEIKPFKNRQEIFKELGNIQDKAKQGFKEGADENSALYRDIYQNFTKFFKDNSQKYSDHMELGQDLVRMQGAKVDIPITKDGEIVSELYNPKKLKSSFDKAINKFDKLADQDKLLEIERLVQQSNELFKTDFKVDKLLRIYERNQNRMSLKGAKKGLTEEQKNLLPNKIKKLYENNQELSKVTEKGLFTDPKKVQKFISPKEQEGVLSATKLAELLPKRLVDQLEIEAAGRLLREGADIKKIPIGVIGSPYVRAANLVKSLGMTPRAQFGMRRFMESEIPGQIGEGARALSRVLSRELVRDDEQKTDVIRDSETNEPVFVTREPYQLERTTAGNLTEKQKKEIEKQRGIRR